MYSPASTDYIGFVIIGRNEGSRLELSLRTLKSLAPSSPIVYVDSGSTDNSVAFAKSIGAIVTELDMSIPFTAARARNAGYEKLIDHHPSTNLVQFLDGDCQISEHWIERSSLFLISHPQTGIVSGRRVEKHPDASVYNRLIDLEWDTPIGETQAVLGDMLVKSEAFLAAGGFNESIIAAEDDDFCLRVRSKGFSVYRIDEIMSYHDADMHSLKQWLKRAKRAGHGYANLNNLYKGYFQSQVRRAVLWGGMYPAAFIISALALHPAALTATIAVALVQIFRTSHSHKCRLGSYKLASIYSCLLFISKPYELSGIIRYWKNKLTSKNHSLIEYK